MLTFFIEAGISSLRLLKTAKVGKLSRLSKIARTQRILKLCKGCRTLRAFKLCRFVATTFSKVNGLFYKTICTFPSLVKMINVLICLFYIYSIIGMELLSTDKDHEEIYFRIVDFNSFSMSLLALF